MTFNVEEYLEREALEQQIADWERMAWEEENYLYNPNEDAGDRD